MSSRKVCIAWLVLLALVASELSGENTGEGPVISYNDLNASCPYNIHTAALPEEVSGVWYVVEILRNESDNDTHPCLRHDFSAIGDQLTMTISVLVNGTERDTRTTTYSSTSPGMWGNSELFRPTFFILGFPASKDSLLMCVAATNSSNTDIAFALRRSPVSDDVVRAATINERASSFSVTQPDLQWCAQS